MLHYLQRKIKKDSNVLKEKFSQEHFELIIAIYMDDCWCVLEFPPPPRRHGLRSNNQRVDPAAAFNDCLNEVHPRVQFTREEEEDKSIAFLDVYLTRQDNGKISTRVYRKSSNTNITIKPQSCQNPLTVIATFKGELCRAHKLCSTAEQTQKEIDFLLDLYEDNHKCNKNGRFLKGL